MRSAPFSLGRRDDRPVISRDVAAALEHRERAREHARRIGDREPDATRAEVDAEHPAHAVPLSSGRGRAAGARGFVASSVASVSASSMPSTFGPPP